MKFDNLVNRLSPKLKAITRKLNGRFLFFNEEDLYQEALLYLWDKYKQQELLDKTDSFILQGCFFFLKNYLRKVCKKIDFNCVSLNNIINNDGNTLEEVLPSESIKSDSIHSMEINFLMEDIQRNLTDRERKTLSLYLEDLPVREIGKRIGISHVMVIKIRNRIRGKCKGYLS